MIYFHIFCTAVLTQDINFLDDLLIQKHCDGSIKLNRYLLRDGYHRELVSEFKTKYKGNLLILEYLSESFYLDKYQLEEMERFGSPHRVKLLREIDLEKPAAFSSPNYIFVFHNITNDHFNVTLPIHIRYQTPSLTSKSVSLEIKEPIGIFIESKEDKWKRLCLDKEEILKLDIPTGESDKEGIITSITILVTTFGAISVAFFVYMK